MNAFAGEVRAISGPGGQTAFSAWADRMCVKERALSQSPLPLEWATLDGLFIVFFFYLSICSEDKVIEHYKRLKGLTRGQAIVQWVKNKSILYLTYIFLRLTCVAQKLCPAASDVAVLKHLLQAFLFNRMRLHRSGCCCKKCLSPRQDVSLIRGGALGLGTQPASGGCRSSTALSFFFPSWRPWVIHAGMICALEPINGLSLPLSRTWNKSISSPLQMTAAAQRL